MDLWKGKVAVVTGASAGIGAELCKDLCKRDVIVVGMARRLDRLELLKEKILETKKDAQFHPVKCDLMQESDIKAAFDHVISKLGGVDILINNAGIIQSMSFLDEDNLDKMKNVIETNITAVVSCTKKAYKSMSDRDVPGYIINISSIAGHEVPAVPSGMKPLLNIYPSTKYALAALVQVLRHELNYFKKNKIRVSNVSPGLVRTEIFEAGGLDLTPFAEYLSYLEPEDISDSVMYLLGTNPRVQIEDIIIQTSR